MTTIYQIKPLTNDQILFETSIKSRFVLELLDHNLNEIRIFEIEKDEERIKELKEMIEEAEDDVRDAAMDLERKELELDEAKAAVEESREILDNLETEFDLLMRS